MPGLVKSPGLFFYLAVPIQLVAHVREQVFLQFSPQVFLHVVLQVPLQLYEHP